MGRATNRDVRQTDRQNCGGREAKLAEAPATVRSCDLRDDNNYAAGQRLRGVAAGVAGRTASRTPMTPLHWGIMGTGGMARAMADVLTSSGRIVAAVGSSREGAAAELTDQLGSGRAESSHEAVAAADDVDVVYVATTNDRHFANVMSCIDRGTAVLCEKPLALDAHQARLLMRASEESGVFLMEAMWMRFQPFFERIQQLVDTGATGPINYVQANMSYLADTDPRRRWMNADLGGGALADIGVYPINLALLLLGPPLETETQVTIGPTGVDLETRVLSRHRNGAVAVLGVSFINAAPSEAVVAGPAGSISIRAPFHLSRQLVVTRPGDEPTVIELDGDGHGLLPEVEEVERCVRAGRTQSDLLPHSHTLAAHSWLDEIRARGVDPTV
ncbi:MAG: Gfo/Idh/MocA family oxidoreductase [Acidimicrobiia bacterium]